jgi:hypothetical protein
MTTYILISAIFSLIFVAFGSLFSNLSKTPTGAVIAVGSAIFGMLSFMNSYRAWYALDLAKNSTIESEVDNTLYYDVFRNYLADNGETLRGQIFYENFLSGEIYHHLIWFGIFLFLATLLLAGWARKEKVFQE